MIEIANANSNVAEV